MKEFLQYWLPSIFWAALIFLLSSNDPAGVIPNTSFQLIKSTRFLGIRLSDILWGLSHCFLYAVLAFLLIRSLGFERELNISLLAIVFGVTLLYGVSDEIHQLFVPGRGFQYVDILMDGVGAIFGLGIYALHRLIFARKAKEESLML